MRKMINNTPSKKTYTEQLCRSISKPKHVLIEASTGESIPISQKAWYSLAKRAGKNNTLLSIIEQVYCRGIFTADDASYNSPEHQAFCRVDSFLHEGKAYELDYDLVTEQCTVPDGRKHMHIIKNAIKTHKKINQKEVIKESNVGFGKSMQALGKGLHKGIGTFLSGGNKSSKSRTSQRSSSPRVAKPPKKELSFDEKAKLAIAKDKEKQSIKWVVGHQKEYAAALARKKADAGAPDARARMTRQNTSGRGVATRAAGIVLAAVKGKGVVGPWGYDDGKPDKRDSSSSSVPSVGHHGSPEEVYRTSIGTLAHHRRREEAKAAEEKRTKDKEGGGGNSVG
jgi:hypothetical protein